MIDGGFRDAGRPVIPAVRGPASSEDLGNKCRLMEESSSHRSEGRLGKRSDSQVKGELTTLTRAGRWAVMQ